MHKLDALTRILEAEPFDAMIIFARTKQATEELAEKLQARGLAAAAINGDIAQAQRERVIQQLKDGKLDILVATDVAARGLDVERISHVLNYDIPYDTESYVHRIGRTGRAGRKGEAVLFVAPRERGMLGAIERATRQKIEQMNLPSVDAVNERRMAKFLDRIDGALASDDLAVFRDLVERYEREKNVPAVEIAAALAQLVQGKAPLLLAKPAQPERTFEVREPRPPREREERPKREHAPRDPNAPDLPMRTYRIEAGHRHGVQPGNIVGAIANEADLEARYIGRIDIRDDYALVDLPDGMPPELLAHMQKVRVGGQMLRMRLAEDADIDAPKRKRSFGPPRGDKSGGPRKPGGFKPGGPKQRGPR
jgi:ATP-dependent RNA helicase DeaD